MSEPIKTAEDLAAEQQVEWSTYVAAYPIDFYGVRAYNTGDPVPVSAVVSDDGGWVPQNLVRKREDAADAIAASATVVDPGPPTIDPATVAAPPAGSPAPTITED